MRRAFPPLLPALDAAGGAVLVLELAERVLE